MDNVTLAPGFKDPVQDAQKVFRNLLDAMSRPGKVVEVGTECAAVSSMVPPMIASALTLLDYETPYWLSSVINAKEASAFLSFHTGARHEPDEKQALFLFVSDIAELPDLSSVQLGTPEYPDRSATIIIKVADFNSGNTVRLSGPGIQEVTEFKAAGLEQEFWSLAQANNRYFPLGIDFIFCSDNSIAALPRSTKIEM